MAKWADYCISAVRNNQNGVIQKVLTHTDNGDSIGNAYEETRQQVIDNLTKGYTYVTIIRDSQGKWQKGQAVFIIVVHGTQYIKTVSNGKTVDNLDDLPPF